MKTVIEAGAVMGRSGGDPCRHFVDRVSERIPGFDPSALRDGIRWALKQDRWDLVHFVGRVGKGGRRFFEFDVPGRGTFLALVDTDNLEPITVYAPGMHANRIDGPILYCPADHRWKPQRRL
ncbi:hypothetical protein [Pseudoroseicyclus aestuarii]|uniref:Uncharacterized protein n=1 Tax=Pseudoroseicyclus aestuarii TaxID=1795041 RepID=A0A318SS24_9RHOB|nr:hypothetical protein [Pseudoroseicyclus aestuarii]PYE84165.1 hypothetical protein DFP88_103533 [Pseudoroseicyclus aestuarii]